MTKRATKQLMRAHITELCKEHGIRRDFCRQDGHCYIEEREIVVPSINSSITYGTALHEIGHIVGKQAKNELAMEAWAWNWAKRHAKVWTPVMEKSMRTSLKAYYEWAKRAQKRGDKNAPEWPERSHKFWQILGYELWRTRND